MADHPFPAISNPQITTTGMYAGDIIINLRELFTDIDLGPLFESWRPIVRTQFLFRSGKIAMTDPDLSNEVVLVVDEYTGIDGNKNLHIPVITGTDDTIVVTDEPQILQNKILSTGTTFDDDLNLAGNAILNAVISGASNTISNIPDSALSSNVALENVANVFTQTQKISLGATVALTLYHATSVVTNGTGISFALQNSTPAETVYAHIFAILNSNTAGSEQGSLAFYTKNGASLVDRMVLDHLSRLRVGTSSAAVRFDPTGLTALRDVTFPNYNGEARIFGVTSVQYKEGWCDFTNLVGEDLLSPIQFYYDTITPTQNLQGTGISLTTGTTSNTGAGFATLLTNGITRRSWNPYLFYRVSLPTLTSGDSNFFVGFTSRATLISPSNSPFTNAESGIMIGYRTTDTEMKVFHNDGTTLTVTPLSPSVPVPAATTNYSFEIKTISTGFVCTVYNSGTTVLGSATITTLMPATTTNLNLQGLLFNPTGVSKAITPTKLYLRSEK